MHTHTNTHTLTHTLHSAATVKHSTKGPHTQQQQISVRKADSLVPKSNKEENAVSENQKSKQKQNRKKKKKTEKQTLIARAMMEW
jgi:hypothetical protein